jgi:hypothetical protein
MDVGTLILAHLSFLVLCLDSLRPMEIVDRDLIA